MIRCVYVAGPLTGGDMLDNVRNAVEAGDRLVKSGFAPLVPHLCVLAHWICPRPYESWMAQDLAWVGNADAVLRLPGESSGADREVAHARKNGIPVFDSVEALVNASNDAA
jgi:hypothetical protein